MKIKNIISAFAAFAIALSAVCAAAESLIPPEKSEGASLFAYYDEPIKVNHDNTISDIISKDKEFSNVGFDYYYKTRFETAPTLTAPYSAGAINSEDKLNALKTLKMIRFLAGLPYQEISLDDYETNTAQHKAVLMAVAGYGHHPAKPDDMDDRFFETANSYRAECIYAGLSNISNSIIGFTADSGLNNIARAGHRMILLKPNLTKFGIGYAYNPDADWSDLIAVHVNYDWAETDSYCAWPNAGYFPIQYFINSTSLRTKPPYPWSLSLGAPYNAPDRDKLTLTLTRKRDNYVWIFDKSSPDLSKETRLYDDLTHLSVDGKNIIFRPDVVFLDSIKNGDVFEVNLSGIEYTDGTPAELKYEIHFFDLEAEKNNSTVTITAASKGEAVEGASVEMYGKTILTDENGEARFWVKNNSTYQYTVSKNGYNTKSGSVKVLEEDIRENITMLKTLEIQIDNPVSNVRITNNSAVKKTISLYTALYDSQNTLMKVFVNNAEILSGSETEVSVSVSNDDYYNADKINLLVWEGMTPVFDKLALK